MKKISLYLRAISDECPKCIMSVAYRFFCHICSKASAISKALISSLSWNLRNSFPPCPVMYTNTFDRSSVKSRFERGTDSSTRPAILFKTQISRKNPKARTCQYSYEVFYRHLIATIVYFNIVPIQIKTPACVCINTPRKLVSRIACCIISQHKDDIRIWYAQSFHCSIPAAIQLY
jgi:hypothetical protein